MNNIQKLKLLTAIIVVIAFIIEVIVAIKQRTGVKLPNNIFQISLIWLLFGAISLYLMRNKRKNLNTIGLIIMLVASVSFILFSIYTFFIAN